MQLKRDKRLNGGGARFYRLLQDYTKDAIRTRILSTSSENRFTFSSLIVKHRGKGKEKEFLPMMVSTCMIRKL